MKDKSKLSSNISLTLAIVFSLAAVVYVFYKTDIRIMQATLAQVHWGWLSLALLVYILNYILRAWRLQILVPTQETLFVELVALNGLCGMYNYLLPGKSGEISYIVLVKRRLRLSLADSTASLVVQRYLDFATNAMFMVLVLIFYLKNLPLWLIYASLTFCGLILASSVLLYWFVGTHSSQSINFLSPRIPWLTKISQLLKDLRRGIVVIYQRSDQFQLLLLTIAIWACINLYLFLIVLSLGYRLSYFQVVVFSIIMIPLTLLPIQGFANLGTHEIGWVAAFSIFGQPESMALNVAFSSHIILLLFVLFLGAVSFVISMVVRTRHTMSKGSVDD